MTNRQYLSRDKAICSNFFLAPQGRRGQVSRLKSKVGIWGLNRGGKPSYMQYGYGYTLKRSFG